MIGQTSLTEERIIDNFAGGGGASSGIELAIGRPVDYAINHDPDAILMHKTNHPYTQHLQASVWDIDPDELCAGLPVGLAWFSPDCKHFSKAKGAALVDRKIRGLAWIALRWAATARPRVIILENVEEFKTWGPVRKGKPVKKLAGTTFRKFITQLQDLGYQVEHRELVAADFGTPTTRKRFYMIARCDGRPIVWPEPTHSRDGGNGKLPWRSAAEVIDWSLPCYSIFATRQEIRDRYGVTAVRPLADNTLKRIICGVDKFTIRSGKPFIVPVGYGEASGQRPIVMAPITISNTGGSCGSPVDQPIGTIRTGGGGQLLAAPCMIQYHTEKTENARAAGLDSPINTIDASNRYGLTTANLVEYYGGGQALDAQKPMHTITSHDREAVVAAHMVKFKASELGTAADEPLPTITAGGGTFAVCEARLCRIAPGEYLGNWPHIRDMLNRHCGYHIADDEVLLLNIDGVDYCIHDIGLRMLTPRELYNATGFPEDYIIDRDYMGNVYPRGKQVARCGNAVCPPVAEALVRANLPEWCSGKYHTMRQLHGKMAG